MPDSAGGVAAEYLSTAQTHPVEERLLRASSSADYSSWICHLAESAFPDAMNWCSGTNLVQMWADRP